MARVPQPAIPAGPVGSVAPEARGAPGLRLDVNADMFGASMGRSISKVGQAAEQVVGFAVKKAEQEDALKLRQLENEVAALDNEYTTQVQSLTGQAKLDFLNNSVDRYKEDLAKVTDKYQFTFENNTSVKGIYSKQATNKFTNFALGQRQEAYKTVLTETNKVSLINATQAAVNKPALLQEPAFLNKIRSLVTDTETGMAAVVGETGTTPESKQRIEALSQEVEMQVISAVVADQLAKGNLRDAAAIVSQAAKKGSGTKAYTQLQSQILPFQNRLLGMDEFAALVSSKTTQDGTPPTLAALSSAVAAETDPDKRDRLRTEFSIYSSARTAVKQQQIDDEGQLYIREVFFNNKAPNDPDLLKQVPTWLLNNPGTATEIFLGAQTRNIQTQKQLTAAEQNYNATGGGQNIKPGVFETIKRVLKNNPAGGVAAVGNSRLAQFVTLEQYNELKALADTAARTIQEQAHPNLNVTDYLRKEFGYSNADLQKLLPGAAKNAITDVMLPFYKKAAETGQPVDRAQLKKAVAAQMVSVQTKDGGFFGTDIYDLAAQAKLSNKDFNPYSAVLKGTANNYNTLSILFDTSADKIKEIREELGDKKFTVDGVAGVLNKNPIKDLNDVNREMDDIYQLAIDSGYAPSFIEYIAKQTGNKTHNLEKARKIINALNTKNAVNDVPLADLFLRWSNSYGR